MTSVDPISMLQPRRRVNGISAVLLPFTDSSQIDWPMIMYGSDDLLGLCSFAPDLFAIRDTYWKSGFSLPGRNIDMTTPLEVDCQTVKSKRDAGEPFLFLDCREKDEYATANIPGTTLLPMSELTTRVGELDSHKDSEIIVHCHHGGRSLRVTNWLRQQGFPKAINMAGGIDHWSQVIDPTVPRY